MKKVLSIAICFFILLNCVLPAQASGGVPQEVMEATKSVVRIQAEHYNSYVTGSGFVIKNDGTEVLIATNDHVVENNPKRIAVWVAQDELVDAEIVFTTSERDLCVLRLSEPVDMKPLTLSEEEPQHGAAIYVVGYPGAGDVLSDTEAHTSDSVTITDGIISAIRRFTIEEGGIPIKLLQVNAAINAGNSGGPLFNTEGEVIGVNTYKVNVDSQGVFGSVDISELWDLLDAHGIVLVEEVPETETAPTEETIPVEEPSPVPVAGIAVGAVLVVLVLLLIVLNAKKRKNVTLRAYMARFPQGIAVNEAASMLLPAAMQLRNLHNDGRLHLHISPDTILVSAKGASLKEPGKKEMDRHCSGFAAPEVYKGVGYGVASDIYSFAALMLFAVTGNVPANSLQQDVLNAEIAALEEAEPAFAAVIRSAMAFLPQDRTQSMQELIYGISAFHNQEFHAAKPEKVKAPKQRKPKEKKQRAKIKAVPIAAVFAVAVLAVALLWKPFIQPEIDAMKEAKRLEVAYLSAVSLMEEGSYEEAMAAFDELTGYQNSDALHEECRIAMENAILEEKYQEAEALAAEGKHAQAGIAFAKLGEYKDSQERSRSLWAKVSMEETISIGNGHTVGLRKDGTVMAVGLNDHGQCNVDSLRDIIAISAGGAHTVGLRADGTVIAVGWNYLGESNVGSWRDIIAISAGSYITAGLCADGTVVSTGLNGGCDVNGWNDITAISAVRDCIVGLCADGTVVAVGNNRFGKCDVAGWNDIVAISAGVKHTVGLRADGTVIAVGNNDYGQCDVSHWKDIIAISVGENHTVGLCADGTVIAVGCNDDGECNVSSWKDIVAINAGYRYTVGLRADGTAVAVGTNHWAQRLVNEWTDIKIPD